MVFTIVRRIMNNSWTPLPRDEQVVRAIRHRKDQFVRKREWMTEDSNDVVYFKHICTVLDHAEKIFKVPVANMRIGESEDGI